jgi:hypothetical protein
MSWKQIAATLGAPIYGVLGLEPGSDYGSGGGDSNPTRLRLTFGPANLLAVETSLKPIDAQTMLRNFAQEVAASLDLLGFPLTIEGQASMLLVDGEYVEFEYSESAPIFGSRLQKSKAAGYRYVAEASRLATLRFTASIRRNGNDHD